MVGVGPTGSQPWSIVPGDRASEAVVQGLASVMQLSGVSAGEARRTAGDGSPVTGAGPRELRVVVEERASRRDRDDLPDGGSVEYAVAPPDTSSMHTIAMMRVADVLARDAQRRGALLMHGTLAELHGTGVVLAGTSQVGKSTAARRLPPPWRALSDDTTLIVPDGRGGYRAHPWPTWSRFFDGDAEVGDEQARWDVESSVPLSAVFVLSQATEDHVEAVAHRAQATALLVDCVEAVSRGMTRDLSRSAAHKVHLEQVRNVEALVAEVPAYHLELSLTGEFWRLLEHTLHEVSGKEGSRAGPGEAGTGTTSAAGEQDGEKADAGFEIAGTFVYTGPSMNPTLAEPQLLETESVAQAPVRVGDVVCFRSPRDGITVVHRVVEAGPDGIRTRGDRNPTMDPWTLQPEDLIAKVVQTRRGETTGGVPGGRAGLLVARSGRLRLALGRLARRTLRGVYRGLAGTGAPARVWSRMAPVSLTQRVVRFGTGPLAEYRLFFGERPVGRWDRRRCTWVVDHPFRLIVDERTLPEPPRRDAYRAAAACRAARHDPRPAECGPTPLR